MTRLFSYLIFWTIATSLIVVPGDSLRADEESTRAHPNSVAVASAHPLATAAGLEVMARGGNAFDSAIAVSAALAVVEPYSSGIGGGGFWLLHRTEDAKTVMIDGRERAPAAATRDMYLDASGEVDRRLSLNGPTAAGIPGVIAGLDHLATNYGALPLAQSLAPAIRLARDGFRVGPRYQLLTQFKQEFMRGTSAGAIFLTNGEIPDVGTVIRQPALAKTLQAVGEHGAEVFYRGEIATQMVAGVQRAGGIWQASDLADYAIVEREPIVVTYRGIKVTMAPPPSSGGIVIAQALKMLEPYDLAQLPKTQRTHLLIEVMRRAYRDRAEYLGDPDHYDIPVTRLLSASHLRARAASIDLSQASRNEVLPPLPAVPDGHGQDTTHFSVMDEYGNRVAATLSINTPFGAGFIAGDTGVLLNNEMDDFSAKRLAPNAYGLVGVEANAIAPGKRPLSSMTPSFVETPDRVGVLGTPGGSRIISMVLLGILEFAADQPVEGWVATPRFHHQYLPNVVQYEMGAFDPNEVAALKKLGHEVKEIGRRYGNMHAIQWDRSTGQVTAASDPRGEGAAAVLTSPVRTLP